MTTGKIKFLSEIALSKEEVLALAKVVSEVPFEEIRVQHKHLTRTNVAVADCFNANPLVVVDLTTFNDTALDNNS